MMILYGSSILYFTNVYIMSANKYILVAVLTQFITASFVCHSLISCKGVSGSYSPCDIGIWYTKNYKHEQPSLILPLTGREQSWFISRILDYNVNGKWASCFNVICLCGCWIIFNSVRLRVSSLTLPSMIPLWTQWWQTQNIPWLS